MIQSDALSRRPDLCPDEDHDNEDMTILPESLFISLIDTDLQQRISSCKEYDHDAADALKLLLEDGLPSNRSDLQDWTVEKHDDIQLMFYKGKNYIPDNLELHREIVKRHHDDLTAGHPGEVETFNAVSEHYWWPGMRTFVKTYVKGCGTCQQFKINRQPVKPSLLPITGPESARPFTQLSIDFITDLPRSDEYDSIMVVVDHGLTKGVILEPCNKTITAEQTVEAFIRRVFANYGLPDKLISDRGPQFAAKTFRDVLEHLKIDSALSTAFHPQTDGGTERVNQEIEAYLAIYCSANPMTWN